jgi:carbon storage regulator
MLALSRGEGQSIIINGTIEVKVVKWSRSSVRLAIQAPREVSVDRDEIWRRINPGAKSPLETAEAERQLRFQNGGAVIGAQTQVIEFSTSPAAQGALKVKQ